MHLTGLLDVLQTSAAFQSIMQMLKSEAPSQFPAQGIIRSARPFTIAALAKATEQPVLVVTARVDRAYDMAEQLPAWLPEASVLRFQEPTAMFYERAPWTETVIRSRIQTLAALAKPITPHAAEDANDLPPILVTSAHALMQKTLPVRDFRAGSRYYRDGQQLDPDKLLRELVTLGYQATSVVVAPGTFSRRGGIIDVFPPALEFPVRIEFWGDEIDSLRTFNPETQRSVESVSRFSLTPTREVLPRQLPAVAEKLQAWFDTRPDIEEDPTSPVIDYPSLENGTIFPTAEFYLPFQTPVAASLIDYLPDNTLVIVEDWPALNDMVSELEAQAIERRQDGESLGQLPPEMPLPYHTWDDLQEAILAQQPLHLGQSEISDDAPASQPAIKLGEYFKPGQRFGGQLRLFLDALQELRYTEARSVVVTRQAQRLTELWNERAEFQSPRSKIENVDDIGSLNFIEGALNEGWILETEANPGLHLLTDAEVFGWQRPEPRRRVQQLSSSPETYFADLDEGDYVVHVDFGIGVFQGIYKRVLDDVEREYLLVEYAGNDMLYVPIHQADRLSKFIGSGNQTPTLNKLGTQDWVRTKKRTQQAVQEIAEELLELYARRSVVQGHAFTPDTPWQHELEASFPYVETEDQLKALRAVKEDMEEPRPMDRLICGDVGYGKTEVALRAAFKAVMDSRQVALLVPTTVLAQQHYTTFSQRLHSFPVKVAMLSRFVSDKDQRQIVDGLARGEIDIVIGTHRLLQDDVQLKNLGLLIIDEEQRFGVTHKEYLKRKRTEVDVLTMTATPIPRTLYMGLTGVRDISLIQTAPQDRLPVITHVGVYDEKLVRQAILREIDRGGQVFFVHNRVQTIHTITERLRRLVPEVSFVIGHGQMPENQLEEVMLEFAEGHHDVLVCTSIIESGLDIPNANTIIIDRADWFGLASLYQLRGRVGRGTNQAFAYIFHPRDYRLTPEARARLDTIGEYTELGSGMSVAVRDLEIRGTGDLLGVRQSGYIQTVGFHLYTELLSEAVKQVRTQAKVAGVIQEVPEEEAATRAVSTVTIDLPVPAYLPTDYVPDMSLRIRLYRRLANIETEEDLNQMVDELNDRFGKMPRAVTGLILQIRVKLLAQQASVTGVSSEGGHLGIKLPYLGTIDRAELQKYLGDNIRVSRIAVWLPPELKEEEWQPLLLDVLRRLSREQVGEMLASA
jgi:transcription-repair coupling factor (superfamily II helicase)